MFFGFSRSDPVRLNLELIDQRLEHQQTPFQRSAHLLFVIGRVVEFKPGTDHIDITEALDQSPGGICEKSRMGRKHADNQFGRSGGLGAAHARNGFPIVIQTATGG